MKDLNMKLSVYTVLLGAAMTTQAAAQSSIDALCGAGHANEAAAFGAVSPNPDGYYLPGLNIQLSHGDPRIVRAVGSDFHLCTRPASTPEMSAAASDVEKAFMFMILRPLMMESSSCPQLTIGRFQHFFLSNE